MRKSVLFLLVSGCFLALASVAAAASCPTVQSGQLTIPTGSYIALLLCSRGGTLTLRRLDTNAQVTVANSLPVGATEIDVACWKKNSVYGTVTASYCLAYSYALSDGDVNRAYKQLKRLGACI